MNSWQASSVGANESYSGRRSVSLGTMPALARLTEDSNLPLAAGSAGWHVNTVTPQCRAKSTVCRVRTGKLVICDTVTVFSLSVRT